ncbi:hypothetical protein AMTR_s00025p00128550 [Amborella trichopoda]|uniref:Uncharacterized protein n=1 Tax=Amborella trichopoda TaxID=13333 RepID=W1PWW5_AMBTC|nr:hypothetical protein AMTR_s00025p00128550 [Amborella trichopoda]
MENGNSMLNGEGICERLSNNLALTPLKRVSHVTNNMREVPIESPEKENGILVPYQARVVEAQNQALGTLENGLGAAKPMRLAYSQPTARTTGDPSSQNRGPPNIRAPLVAPKVGPTKASPQTPTAQVKAGPTQAPMEIKVGPTRATLSPDVEAKVGSRQASRAQETPTKPIASPRKSKVSPTKTPRDPTLGTMVGPNKSPLAPSLDAQVGPIKAPIAPSKAAAGPSKAQQALVVPTQAKDHSKGSVTSPIQEKGLDKDSSLPRQVQYDVRVGPEKSQAQEKGPSNVDPTTNSSQQKSGPTCVKPQERDQVVTKVEAVQEKGGVNKFQLPRVVSNIDKKSGDYIQRFKDKMARAISFQNPKSSS